MTRFYKYLFALVLIATPLFATQVAIADQNSSSVDFSMVISGGASLGAYESGYNWASIKMLSEIKAKNTLIDPKMRSAAGASAGSINALLSAIYWCQEETLDELNSVDNNLFFETWVNLGIEDILIKGEDPTNKSTLLTRKVLRQKADKILKHMKRPIFREGCEIPIGFTVTKVVPVKEDFQGITIKNQSFSVPFTLKSKEKKLIIENREMPRSPIFYLSIPGIEKETSKITDVLFASSAFPGGFQQVKLHYEYKNKRYDAYFIDGGVANNIPLDLATELNQEAKTFVLIDPDNMRKDVNMSEKDKQKSEEPPVGFITSSILPLLSSINIFRNAKLYQAMNQYFWNNPNRKLILSSRTHPITGEFLGAFGAFLDKNFRLYDYYVGVYDAIYHMAKALKERGHFPNRSQIEVMNIFMEHLGIDKNQDALTAYKFFLATEFGDTKPTTNNRYASIYNSFDLKVPDQKKYSDKKFTQFLKKLDMRYLPTKPDSFLAIAKKDVDDWARRPLRKVVNRITALENDRAEVYPSYKPIAKAVSIAAWGGSTFIKDKQGWDILPLNAPRDVGDETLQTAMRLLPSEMAIDAVNGGLSFGYSAYWYHNMGPLSGIELKPSYILNKDDGDFIRMDVSIFSEFDDYAKVGLGISGFGDLEGSFYKRDTFYGANVYVDVMDIFRITYVQRYGEVDDNEFFYLGIENIPSLIYWLSR